MSLEFTQLRLDGRNTSLETIDQTLRAGHDFTAADLARDHEAQLQEDIYDASIRTFRTLMSGLCSSRKPSFYFPFENIKMVKTS